MLVFYLNFTNICAVFVESVKHHVNTVCVQMGMYMTMPNMLGKTGTRHGNLVCHMGQIM